MRSSLVALSLASFAVASTLQLVLNDVPGLFVAPVVAPLAAAAVSRSRAHGAAGLAPIVLATAGYMVARAVEGNLFVSYGVIADALAILVLLGTLLAYPILLAITNATLRRRDTLPPTNPP